MIKDNEIFELELGGNTYTIEFTRDAIKTAENYNVSSSSFGELQRISIILYVGLMKHHSFITLKKAGKIIDEALEEGYTLEDFADITEEFTANYRQLFSSSANTKKKSLVTRRNHPTATTK